MLFLCCLKSGSLVLPWPAQLFLSYEGAVQHQRHKGPSSGQWLSIGAWNFLERNGPRDCPE